MAKRRSVQRARDEIRPYLKRAIESGTPEVMKELVKRLKEELGLIIDEQTAMYYVHEEMTSRELDRASRGRRGKS